MLRNKQWFAVVLIAVGLLLGACRPAANTAPKIQPAQVDKVEGSALSRLRITEQAAKRLAIKTAPITEERVERKRIVGGQVEAMPDAQSGDVSKVRVRMNISAGEMDKVAQDQPAMILPLVPDNKAVGIDAQATDVTTTTKAALYYVVDKAGHGLVPGQRVRAGLTLKGSGTQQKVIPYSAVIYDVNGDTWVYTNPETLVFIRARITIDYIDADKAILTDGPPVGTAIVTAGAAELFGTEFGVGK